MNRAIKYRIYPTKSQEELLQKTFGCCRKIWNLMLTDKINYYKETKQTLQTTPAKYKKEYDYLKEVDSLALANVQLHLQTAYKNFFGDKKIGFPKFKALKISKKSYTTNNQKESTRIANLYDVICVENLDMTAMSNKGFRNGKATLDNGYGMFLNMLEYKLQDRGKYFVKVDKWYASSQICSKCGNKKKIKLNERTYTCECGNNIDRDLNAAINIKNEGLRLLKKA